MKRKILLLIITFPIWGLGGFSCSKSDDPTPPPNPISSLPPETQTGANTFGCYINGNLLIPRDGVRGGGVSGHGMILWGGYPNVEDYSEIEVRDFKSLTGAKIIVHIQSLNQLRVNEYIINESNGESSIDGLNQNYVHCIVFDNISNTYKKYISYENCGSLKITKFVYVPSNSSIISGVFKCKVRNIDNPSEQIEITNGRFDINVLTLLTTKFP